MSLFIGIEFTRNELMHYILNRSYKDFKKYIKDDLIDFFSDDPSLKNLSKEYNIKCETIKDIDYIFKDIEKIYENPFLILSSDWSYNTLKVFEKNIEDYIEDYTLYNHFEKNDFYTISNNNKYYLGLKVLTLDCISFLSHINKINDKKIEILKKFQTNFYLCNIFPIHQKFCKIK